MESRDYLKKQIDQAAQAVGSILNDYLGNNPVQDLEMVEKAFSEELALNLEEILSLENPDFIQLIQKERGWSHEALEGLADLFFKMASDAKGSLIHKQCAGKSLHLYEFLYRSQVSFSFDWITKMNTLKLALN